MSSAEPQPKFYERADFLQLRREWRRKLSRAGFRDIETDRGSLVINRCDHEDRRRLADTHDWASYRKLCARWLYVRVWPSRHRKRLWELHSEGVNVRKATVRMWPMHANHKSHNETLLGRDAAEMMTWSEHEVMKSEAELRADNPMPANLWEEAMQAEGFDPEGYLVPSEGTRRVFDGYGGR